MILAEQNLWLIFIPGYSLAPTLIVCLILSCVLAWYCGVETGIYRFNRLRLHLACRNKDPRAFRLEGLLHDQRGLISSFLVGTNLSSYLLASIATAYLSHRGFQPHQAELWTTIVLAPILFIFAETVPKNCFYLRANALILRSSRFIYISYWIIRLTGLTYLLKVFSGLLLKISSRISNSYQLTEDWDHHFILVREGFSSARFSPVQTGMAERILTLPERSLTSSVTPIHEVFMLPVDISRDEFIAKLRESPCSQIPLYEDNKSNVVGTVDAVRVLSDIDKKSPRDLLQSVPKIRFNRKLLYALEIMKKNASALTIVTDQYDNVIGIISFDEIVKQILGETSSA